MSLVYPVSPGYCGLVSSPRGGIDIANEEPRAVKKIGEKTDDKGLPLTRYMGS
jgi:hypothetical protein